MDRRTALVVEDEAIVALLIEQVLTGTGYEVCGVARSERQALALAERFRPSHALVDVNLSPGGGRALARRRSGGRSATGTARWCCSAPRIASC